MRSFLAASITLLLSIGSASSAFADPVGDLTQMQGSFSAVRSMHFDIVRADGQHMSVDMIKPDRYRGTLAGNVRVVIVGPTTWVWTGKHWAVDTKARGAGGEYLQNARTPLNGEPARDFTVVDLGAANVGSASARHYRATRIGTTVVDDLWVGANHLPLQVVHRVPQGSTTIRYSQYNSVPAINAPM